MAVRGRARPLSDACRGPLRGYGRLSTVAPSPLTRARSRVAPTLALACLSLLACPQPLRDGYLGLNVIDAAKYDTYAWLEYERRPDIGEGAERRAALDALFRERIAHALAARGFRPAQESAPSVFVDYHTAAAGEINSEGEAESYLIYERGSVVRPGAGRELAEGALVIDVIDGETMRLLWRGWGFIELAELEGDPARTEAELDALVDRIMAHLPPRT